MNQKGPPGAIGYHGDQVPVFTWDPIGQTRSSGNNAPFLRQNLVVFRPPSVDFRRWPPEAQEPARVSTWLEACRGCHVVRCGFAWVQAAELPETKRMNPYLLGLRAGGGASGDEENESLRARAPTAQGGARLGRSPMWYAISPQATAQGHRCRETQMPPQTLL